MMNCEKLLKGIEETLQYDILKPLCDENTEENHLNWLLEQAPLRSRSEKKSLQHLKKCVLQLFELENSHLGIGGKCWLF